MRKNLKRMLYACWLVLGRRGKEVAIGFARIDHSLKLESNVLN